MDSRNEEIQEIIDRMPTYWCKWVAGIFTLLICGMLLLGFLIHYPETVDGEISITATTAPTRLLAATTGRLHLVLARGTIVRKGEIIAYIESGMKIEDYYTIKEFLSRDVTSPVPHELELGEISASYNSFILSLERWKRIQSSKSYEMLQENLQEQVKAKTEIVKQLSRNQEIKRRVRANIERELLHDSILNSKGMTTETELSTKRNNYYAQLESEANLRSAQLTTQAEIKSSQINIARNKIEEEETVDESFTDMLAKRNLLLNEIRLWEEKFLIRAKMNGRLDYLGFWRNDVVVQTGYELFSILPSQNEIIGEALINSYGAGKVKIGQEVNVKLNDYPYDEFGVLKGTVKAISSLTNRAQVQNRVVETYLVQIHFPNGLKTNFGYQLPLKFESKGTAEIITKPKRLIQRLFDNLKANTTK